MHMPCYAWSAQHGTSYLEHVELVRCGVLRLRAPLPSSSGHQTLGLQCIPRSFVAAGEGMVA